MAAITDVQEAETTALRGLLEQRDRGPFINMKESRRRMERMIAAKKRAAEICGRARRRRRREKSPL